MPRRKLLDLAAVTAGMDEGLREFVAPGSDIPTLDNLEWEIPSEVVEANPRIEVDGAGQAVFRFNGDGGHDVPPRVGTGALDALGDRELTAIFDGVVLQNFDVRRVAVEDSLDRDLLEGDEQQARAEIARYVSGQQRLRTVSPSMRLRRLYSPPHVWLQDEAENEAALVSLRQEQPVSRIAPDTPFVWTTPAQLEQLREMRGLIDVPAYIQSPIDDQLLADRVRYMPRPGSDGPEYFDLAINHLIGPTRKVGEFIAQFGNIANVEDNVLTVSYGERASPWYAIAFHQVVLMSYSTAVSAGPLSIYEALVFRCTSAQITMLRAQDSNEPQASYQET